MNKKTVIYKPIIIVLLISILILPNVLGETIIGAEDQNGHDQRREEQKAFKIQNQTTVQSTSGTGIIELNWYQKIGVRIKAWYYQVKQKFQ